MLCAGLGSSATINYVADSTTNFPNPERGFAVDNDPPYPPNGATWDLCACTGVDYTAWTEPVEAKQLDSYRLQGWSVYMIRYHLAEFRNKPLSQQFLDRIESDCRTIRSKGFKMIPRFAYNYPKGGPDAPVDIVLQHIGQLKPWYTRNADIFAFVDLGLIGCWGENHTSCNNLVSNGRDPNQNSWAIIDSLFKAVPAKRMIAVRYPAWKFRKFGGSDVPIAPLTDSEAYTGTMKARWAHIDDCPVCGEWDCGTWWSTRNNAPEIRQFLAGDNLHVSQGGETGDIGDCQSSGDDDQDGWVTPHFADCDRILWLFSTEHWSVISGMYGEDPNKPAYQTWKNQGCYSTIGKKLGYRFRLTSATIPDQGQAGASFAMSFGVTNDGWAPPYNPRGLSVVLRDVKTGKRAASIVLCNGKSKPSDYSRDPRYWKPGTTTTVRVDTLLPGSMPAGDYAVMLHLFDPEDSLVSRPEYAIRLANQNTWEDSTGMNSLKATVKVSAGSTAERTLNRVDSYGKLRIGATGLRLPPGWSRLEILSIDGRVRTRIDALAGDANAPSDIKAAGISFIRIWTDKYKEPRLVPFFLAKRGE
jgi:hypothetical protein